MALALARLDAAEDLSLAPAPCGRAGQLQCKRQRIDRKIATIAPPSPGHAGWQRGREPPKADSYNLSNRGRTDGDA